MNLKLTRTKSIRSQPPRTLLRSPMQRLMQWRNAGTCTRYCPYIFFQHQQWYWYLRAQVFQAHCTPKWRSICFPFFLFAVLLRRVLGSGNMLPRQGTEIHTFYQVSSDLSFCSPAFLCRLGSLVGVKSPHFVANCSYTPAGNSYLPILFF